MSYIDKSLGDGEIVIARANFHWLYVTAAWACLLVPGLLLLALLGKAESVSFAMDDSATMAAIAAGVLFVIGLVAFLRLMIRKWSTEIGVTSHRFVERYGLLSMHTNEIALPNIEGVRVNQSILGRLFGYGTVRVEGTGVDSVTTPSIADPVGFVRAIQTAREHTMARFEAGKTA
jgi:voltage-gated potassium channel Kch